MATQKIARSRSAAQKLPTADDLAKALSRRVLRELGKGQNTLLLDLKENVAIANSRIGDMLSEQAEARESRRLMHQKLDASRYDIAMHGTILQRIEPLVDRHEELLQLDVGRRQERQRLLGGLVKLRDLIWGAIATAAAMLGYRFPKT